MEKFEKSFTSEEVTNMARRLMMNSPQQTSKEYQVSITCTWVDMLRSYLQKRRSYGPRDPD